MGAERPLSLGEQGPSGVLGRDKQGRVVMGRGHSAGWAGLRALHVGGGSRWIPQDP